MRPPHCIFAGGGGAGGVGLGAGAPRRASLAGYVPRPGRCCNLEARDFAGLERDWNGSAERKLWLGELELRCVLAGRGLYERLAGGAGGVRRRGGAARRYAAGGSGWRK